MDVAQDLGFRLRRENDDYPDEEIGERVTEIVEMLGGEELLAQHPSELSGGQKQRVALGQAIICELRIFFFDEPLADPSANFQKTMQTEIGAPGSKRGSRRCTACTTKKRR